MGTLGDEIIRHQGVYFIWHHTSDGYPEAPGLGWELFEAIPDDPKELEQWAARKRAGLSALYAALVEHSNTVVTDGFCSYATITHGNGFEVATTYEVGPVSTTYEIDLDHMVFHINRLPIYHLDNLPPIDILVRGYEASCGRPMDYDILWHDTPENYRIDLARFATPVAEHATLEPSACRFVATVTDPLDILSAGKRKMILAERLSLRLTACYVNKYAHLRRNMLIEDFLFVNSHRNIGAQGREIARALATVTLLPMHIMAFRHCWTFDGPALDEFWFLRKHICLSLANDLQDERNARCHVARIVDHIMSTSSTPEIVFGVLFSVFHCIVVRVDKSSASFSRTTILQFLPQPQAKIIPLDEWFTPGMSLLTRLSHLRAADDIDFFYGQAVQIRDWHNEDMCWGNQCGNTLKWSMFKRHRCPQIRPSPSQRLPRLPNEILAMIANEIDSPETLLHYALTSRAVMAAAIPRLRFPQVRSGTSCNALDTLRSSTVWTHGHILESYEDDGWLSAFNITYRGAPAVLDLSQILTLEQNQDPALYLFDLEHRGLPVRCFSLGKTYDPRVRGRLPSPHTARSMHPSCWRRLARLPYSSSQPAHLGFWYYIKWTPNTAEELDRAYPEIRQRASKARARRAKQLERGPANESWGARVAGIVKEKEEKEKEKEKEKDDGADDGKDQHHGKVGDGDQVADDALAVRGETRPSENTETQRQASAEPAETGQTCCNEPEQLYGEVHSE